MTENKKRKEKLKMTDSWPLIRRLAIKYLKPQKNKVFLALFLMLIAAAMTGAMAKLMEPIIDNVFAEKNRAMIVPVAMGVFGVFVLRGFANYGHSVLMNAVTQRIVSKIQKDMFGHLVYSDVSFFHQQQSGHLLSRFIADTVLIRTALGESLTGIGKNAFTLIFLVGVMFSQDWKLSIISLFVFPAAAYIIMRLGKKIRKVSTNTQIESGHLTSMLNQAFQGNRHVKAYGTEEFEKNRVYSVVEKIYDLMCKSFRISAIATPMAEMLSGLAIVMIIVYGGFQVIEGQTTTGKLFSFITAFLLAFEPMKRLVKVNNIGQAGLAAADRLFKMLDIAPSIHNKVDAVELKISHPAISFNNVFFAYPDGTEAVKGISFVAPAGKTVALVGESGGGKSTILSLIPRFYDVTSGSIKINEHDIRDVTLDSLRKNMALVSQEVAIFSDTIRENIAYGSPRATDEQVEAAARAANAHDFIMELSEGYNTRVGENGVRISGGQRQRIAIARAMLRNAPILLLDEATSALDATSERLVQSALEKLQKDKTTIIVAHRLSTIMNADIIYVLMNGEIVEQGRHADLIEKNGAYSRLYRNLSQEAA